MSNFDFTSFIGDGQSFMGFNKKRWTKEKALKQSVNELDVENINQLEISSGFVRYGFGRLDDEEGKTYNNWWLQGINDDEISFVDIGKGKTPVWIVKEKENE